MNIGIGADLANIVYKLFVILYGMNAKAVEPVRLIRFWLDHFIANVLIF